MFRPRSTVWKSRMHGRQVLTVSSYFDADFAAAAVKVAPQEICIDDFSMLEMMHMLHDEVRTPGVATHELVSAIGNILRIKLTRLMSQRARIPSIDKPCRSIDIAMLHELISTTGRGLPTTAGLARQLNISRRSLLRLFKATTGTSPSRYIEEMKLESAKTLLSASRMTMKQIAHESGYSTASHFSARFHELTGLTPSAFRRGAARVRGPIRFSGSFSGDAD